MKWIERLPIIAHILILWRSSDRYQKRRWKQNRLEREAKERQQAEADAAAERERNEAEDW